MQKQKEKNKISFKKLKRKSIRIYLSKNKTNFQDQQNTHNRSFKIPKIKNISPQKYKQRNTTKTIQSYRKKQDIQFEGIVDDIQPRGSAFVKLGFTSQQKKTNRKLFGDIFNLRYRDLKGTITIADLWSNKDRSNFLKENKIKVNKMKLLQKLSWIKKKHDPNNRQGQIFKSMKELKIYTQQLLDSCRSISQIKNTVGKTFSQRNYTQQLRNIKNNLLNLKKADGYKDLRTRVKNLQQCKDKIQQIDKKYFFKLIDMF